MFPPIFPLYIRALAPLHDVAPLVWLSGVACLWATRYTHQLATRWGSRFYALSAVVRPVGILLIGAGWVALYSPGPQYTYLSVGLVGWLPWGNWTEVLCWVAILLFLAFGRGRRAVHPPTDDDRLGPGHRALGALCVLLFLATFSPVPFQQLI